MRKKILGGMLPVAIAVLATVNINFNKDAESGLSALNLANVEALAQGESGGGGNCIHIYEVTSQGMGIMPMQCCLTRHDFVLEYFECYIGDCGSMTGHCPGNVTQVTSYYVGQN
ncbi:MAG TPA: NVEALA domain-containing protein [Sphingobacterium sp.]|nr:NVEALA domain-containing protein [Sphingobacterium sp.]